MQIAAAEAKLEQLDKREAERKKATSKDTKECETYIPKTIWHAAERTVCIADDSHDYKRSAVAWRKGWDYELGQESLTPYVERINARCFLS